MFEIKKAQKKDLPDILRLIKELACYEGLSDEVLASEQLLEYEIFKRKSARALLIKQGKESVGYAIYFYSFSTFLARAGIYLEDLYITPKWRFKGAGMQVFRYLAKICKDENLGRLEWACLHENELGVNFYEKKLSATNLSKQWRVYRLDSAGIEALNECC